ncbi:NADPH:quinone reductase [Nocardiopsis sp. TSRI0078]|uniref:quinone oxidoreductase family protein n=1 Tax=unclassified Nocardiopsis TaxID=2649073 RepID=UPI000939D12C|nr:zinc-binding alcohol dehydrogenase family protein [Nocardiopsis sp. TSRI0078]OKI16855.1 NADPH:quinone reductase [Nocardiopsis sp. TSRI0078]
MIAAQIPAPGRPPVLTDLPSPQSNPGRAVVEVLAAPITPLDLLCAGGQSYFGVPATPYVPGVQGVGRWDGRLVWFPTAAGMAPGDGSMAERVSVPEDQMVVLPEDADPVAVAALGLSAVAAHMALTWRGGLAAGETVLVLGAGGVVGLAAVQLARTAGAGRVVAAARSDKGRERAARAGADAVASLDTDDVDALAALLEEAAQGPVDLVLDPLFGAPAAAAARVLRPEGRLVNLGSSAGEHAPLDSGTLRGRSLRLLGYTNNALTPQQRSAAVDTVARECALGRLSVPFERVPLEEAARGWERQARGVARGRIVLVP